MNRSIKYLIFFVVLFFALDLSTGFIMKKFFPEITFGTYGKINKSLGSSEEILIFGSSRAEHHYDPVILSNETGLTCYNTGVGGYGLFYNYALFNEIIEEHKPKVVILDLSPNVIVDPKTYAKLNIFNPYYSHYASFNEILQIDPDFSKFKLFFNMYMYNSTAYDFIRSRFANKKQGNGYKGLIPEMKIDAYRAMNLSDEEMFDTIKKKYFEKFIQVAIDHKVRLICLVSPTYEKFDAKNRIIGELRQMALAKGIEFYDYSDFKLLYKKPQYFKDQLHMNVKGVKMFNSEVSSLINY